MELLASGYGLVEGPRVDAEDRLYFSDVHRGGVYRRGADGTLETIVDGVTGVVVPAGDTATLVAALAELAGNQERLLTMGEAARSRVRNGFLLDHAVDRHEQLLSELIGVLPHARTPTTT